MQKIIRAEIDDDGNVIRVFRSVHESILFSLAHPFSVCSMPRSEAVEEIRRQVFLKSNGECLWCETPITWDSFHMHEENPRGRSGEISTSNSIPLCARCHLQVAHGNRQWGGGPK